MAEVEKNKHHFEVLNALNVNEHTEKKEGLTYLTWSWAWAEVKKIYPEASYTIFKNENGLPYVYDPLTGYMVYTTVTIEGITHEMWLPVMDSKNKAMKSEPYTYTTKYGARKVDSATMFDINKTVMRCLVKNLAMFGLGLYIYAGEDLPEEDKPEDVKTAEKLANQEVDPNEKIDGKALRNINDKLNALDVSEQQLVFNHILTLFSVQKLKDLTVSQYMTLTSTFEQVVESARKTN